MGNSGNMHARLETIVERKHITSAKIRTGHISLDQSGQGQLDFMISILAVSGISRPETKLFADETSLFTVVYDAGIAADKLNIDPDVLDNLVHH